MQTVDLNKRKSLHHMQNIWLSVCILTLMVLATVALLASGLSGYIHKSDCQISLFDNKTVAAQNTNSASTTKTSTRKLTGKEAQKLGFKVTDKVSVWTTDTAVDLFSTSYSNKDGVVTVRSGNSDKVIAPGTDGKYTFSLKNTGQQTADYKVWMETKINAKLSTGLPFKTRMSGPDGWILGDSDTWEDAEKLDDVSLNQQVPKGKNAEYTIYWKWPFDQEIDVNDTDLGNLTADQKITYTVVIHTMAAEAVDSNNSGSDNDNNRLQNNAGSTGTADTHTSTGRNAAKTADTSNLGFWLMIFAGAALGITVVLYLRSRKKS